MVVVLQLSLFHLHGLEGHPQQNSFAFLLGLGTGNDQVQSVLYHCLVPSRKGKEGGFVLQVLQKWGIAVAHS